MTIENDFGAYTVHQDFTGAGREVQAVPLRRKALRRS